MRKKKRKDDGYSLYIDKYFSDLYLYDSFSEESRRLAGLFAIFLALRK